MTNLFAIAKVCLEEKNLNNKILLSFETSKREPKEYSLKPHSDPLELTIGRPDEPRLVSPKALPRRGIGTELGKYSFLHAIAHIEFNAINLAWDAIYRFQEMPEKYYWDWLKVAGEETRHFMMLRKHLSDGGYDYGDFDAHDGLWDMAQCTAVDVLERMAIIPRVLEARGLDVTPSLIEKFENVGEEEIVSTLKIIYEEEIEHVSIGNYWFQYLCHRRGFDPEQKFVELVKKYELNKYKSKLNKTARIKAGFTQAELIHLENNLSGSI